MLSNHIAPEFVRQLDRTALKNCMELALLRHEKDVSVKQGNQHREASRFQKSLEKERDNLYKEK